MKDRGDRTNDKRDCRRTQPHPLQLEFSEPKLHRGSCNARELDNSLWYLEKYFDIVRILDDVTKLHTTLLYSKMLWCGGVGVKTSKWGLHRQYL